MAGHSARCRIIYPCFILFICLVLLTGTKINAAQVSLMWDANPDPSISGYRVYYGTASYSYSKIIDVGNQTSATVGNLQKDVTYYFAVTDYDGQGAESEYSNEVSYPPPPPPLSCSFSLSPPSQSLPASDGTGQISLTTQDSCSWTATSDVPWTLLTSNSSGTGSATLNYTVSASAQSTSRTGSLTIAGQIFTITQAGQTCTYSLSPTSKSSEGAADSGSVSVTAGSGCAWTATSNSPWITITSGSSGTGNGTVNYSIAANKGTSPRTGTMTIAKQVFWVNQAGFIQTYTLTASAGADGTISPQGSVTVNAGDTQTFNITANSGYRVDDVRVDGVSVGNVTSYTFSNVSANHTITASFTTEWGGWHHWWW